MDVSGRQIRSERLAAEEAVTIPGRTRAVGVEGRTCGRTDEGEKERAVKDLIQTSARLCEW